MLPQCEQIKEEYENIKILKKEFYLEYQKAVETDYWDKAKKLKTELEQKRDMLREKLDPYYGWERYQNGEVILEYKGKFSDWQSHPKGIVIQKGDEFLLNGKELLYKGEWHNWWPHPKGIVIRKDDEFLLNGKELLYKGKFSDWRSHPKGIVIQTEDKWIFCNQSGKKI